MRMKSHEGFMKIAIDEARKGMSKGDRPFGAVLVKNGRMVARIHATSEASSDLTAHAETSAIRRYMKSVKLRDLRGYVIYASGEPCLMCSAVIAMAKISEVVIAANSDDMPQKMRVYKKSARKISPENIFREYEVNIKVTRGVLRTEVIKLYRQYVKEQDRQLHHGWVNQEA